MIYAYFTSKNDLCPRPKIGRVQRSFDLMLTSYIIRARPCKHSDVISLKYTDIRGGSFLDWISGFQSRFPDFRVDFWISKWISGFQSGFLDFRVDFWISLDFWILDWISADSVRDFFRSGLLASNFGRPGIAHANQWA